MIPRRPILAAAVLALACLPALADTAAPKHHHHHRRHVARPLPPQPQYGSSELHRIPSMDPPFCDSPNVITVENCRASMNGRR